MNDTDVIDAIVDNITRWLLKVQDGAWEGDEHNNAIRRIVPTGELILSIMEDHIAMVQVVNDGDGNYCESVDHDFYYCDPEFPKNLKRKILDLCKLTSEER